MIIDSHCHLIGEGWNSDEQNRNAARFMAALMERMIGVYPELDSLIGQMMSSITDTTGEKLVSSMDSAGVSKACVFTADTGLASAVGPRVSIEDTNRMVAEAAKRFPDRLIPFFGIDPRRPNGLQMFETAVKDWKMRGLKLYPPAGFFPQDAVCHPYYRKCMEYGIPVLFHTGGSVSAPLKARCSLPIYIDDVAADFPDLAIIVAHSGGFWWEETGWIAMFKPNIYLDLSGWQMIFIQKPSQVYQALRKILDTVGPWRIFFGSDSPFFNAALPLDRWVKSFKEPDLSSCPDIKFTKEEIEIFMGKAFARLMKLN